MCRWEERSRQIGPHLFIDSIVILDHNSSGHVTPDIQAQTKVIHHATCPNTWTYKSSNQIMSQRASSYTKWQCCFAVTIIIISRYMSAVESPETAAVPCNRYAVCARAGVLIWPSSASPCALSHSFWRAFSLRSLQSAFKAHVYMKQQR